MKYDIEDFKKQKEVIVITQNYNLNNIIVEIQKIKNITKNNIIKLENNDSFYDNGVYKSSEKFKTYRKYILPYCNETKCIFEYCVLINNIRKSYKELNSLFNNINNDITKYSIDTNKLTVLKELIDNTIIELQKDIVSKNE